MFPRQPLGDEGIHAHDRHRHVDARPPLPARASAGPELVPGDGVRAAELERLPVDVVARDRLAEVVATSSAQIGWIRCLPLPVIGVTGE
jgi:hypothetical protein